MVVQQQVRCSHHATPAQQIASLQVLAASARQQQHQELPTRRSRVRLQQQPHQAVTKSAAAAVAVRLLLLLPAAQANVAPAAVTSSRAQMQLAAMRATRNSPPQDSQLQALITAAARGSQSLQAVVVRAAAAGRRVQWQTLPGRLLLCSRRTSNSSRCCTTRCVCVGGGACEHVGLARSVGGSGCARRHVLLVSLVFSLGCTASTDSCGSCSDAVSCRIFHNHCSSYVCHRRATPMQR